jgi:ABC-type phosphate/phosphonate transport system substrate-binding protein
MEVSRWLIAALVTLGLSLITATVHPAQKAADPDVISIGIVDSLLKDLSPAKRKLVDTDLPKLVNDFTGLKSRVFQGGDPFAASKKLAAGDWHLGLFQGIEFAWAQAKDPKLRPLLVALNRQRTLHALLMAKKDNKLAGFADLKGKEVVVQQSGEHCRLFAEKGAGGDVKKFFGKLTAISDVEAALDDVLLDKVQAAIVDSVALENYKDIHPGRFDRLKELAKSEPFPPKVVAYREGALSDRILEKFRAGMLEANKTPKGREAMADVKITAFETVPSDFPQLLGKIVKAYPAAAK